MKKLNRIAFVVALSFLALLNVSAQEATFEERTLETLKKDSAVWTDKKKLRRVSVYETFQDGDKNPLRYTKVTGEFLPPDRRRYVTEVKTSRGSELTEEIYIGEQRFIRRDGGEWEILAPPGGYGMGNGSGGGDRPTLETTVVRTLSKNVTVNNRKADLYKTVTTVKVTYPTRTFTNVFTKSFWFDSSGRMLRSAEEERRGNLSEFTRTTADYEYDPNLKIEAPIIKKKPEAKIKQ